MSQGDSAKTRTPNFTASEKCHLLRIIAMKYSHILEDKKTNRVSNKEKEKAWIDIESDFNASSTSSTQRNAASLKKCYENRKKELRKTLAEEKKEVTLTGGGPPPKIKKDESFDVLLSIINKKTLVGVDNRFDDDGDETPINIVSAKKDMEFIFTPEGTDVLNSDELLVSHDKNISQEAGQNSGENESSIMNWSRKLQQPVNDALQFTETEKEKTLQKTPNANRRRPTTVVKTLTSSDVAKKYNLLLDKRLALVDQQLEHSKAEKVLIIKKLNLEVEILEFELNHKKANVNKK